MSGGQHHESVERFSDPGSQLRRNRPRTRWSLGEKERRARRAVEQALKPTQRTALTVAQEQLDHVREVAGGGTGSPVIDLVKLEHSEASQAVMLRMFTDDILSRRRAKPSRDVVFCRQEDVTMLAGLLSCPTGEVVPLLERLGVLAE